MAKYSRFYLSPETHDDAVTVAKITGTELDLNKSMSVIQYSVPVLRPFSVVELDETTYDLAFYPIKLSNIQRNGAYFLFKHKLTKSVYPQQISIEDQAGNLVDTSIIYYVDTGTERFVYHNLVNTFSKYYFIRYPKLITDGVIDFGYREILRCTPVMSEGNKLSDVNSSTYYVDVTDTAITLNVAEAGNYALFYLNEQLLYFGSKASIYQNWYPAVKKFAYKHPTYGTVFSTLNNYYSSEFHPFSGINCVVEHNINCDDNDVMRLSAIPVFFSEVEFRVWDLDDNQPLPVRSLDPNTGYVCVNRDNLLSETDRTEFNLAYYVSTQGLNLDVTTLSRPKYTFKDFNPVLNNSITNKFVMVYVRPMSDSGERIYEAIFEIKSYYGKQDLYLTEVIPSDPVLAQYLQSYSKLSYVDFVNNFDLLTNPSINYPLLILGVIVVSHNIDITKFIDTNVEDVRNLGGGIDPDEFLTTVTGYPETRYYWDVQPHGGDVIPAHGTILMYVPKDLLTYFEEDDIYRFISKRAAVGALPIMITTNDDNKMEMIDYDRTDETSGGAL